MEKAKSFILQDMFIYLVEEPRWILQNLKTLPPEEQQETENK